MDKTIKKVMRKSLLLLFFLPLLSFSQTFEKVISETYFQRPSDLIETDDGYLLLTSEGVNDNEDTQSRIYLLDKNGVVVKQHLFNGHYIDKVTNIVKISDTTYLCVGHYVQEDNCNLKNIFRIINNDLDILDEKIIETSIFISDTGGFTAYQSYLVKTKDKNVMFVSGYDNMTNNLDGVYIMKMSNDLVNTSIMHYKNLPYKFFSLPECILPMKNEDTLLLFLSDFTYKIDTSLRITDTLPEDFTRFSDENGSYAIWRPLSAGWIDDKLLIGGSDYIANYNKNLLKDNFIKIKISNIDSRGGYYSCMSVNNNYAYVSITVGVSYSIYYGSESKLRLIKVDKNLNVQWDRFYKENSGFYYYAFNTLATADGGCMIAAIRDNYEQSGYKADIYLLKVDSLGNYTPSSAPENESIQSCIFPNPGQNQIYLTLTENRNGIFKLYNIEGKLVYSQVYSGTQATFGLPALPKGMYLYEVINDDGKMERGKWIKQ